MPSILRTVLPRIQRSLQDRGVIVSLGRSFLLPFHLVREYLNARKVPVSYPRSEFDLLHGVDTDGDLEDRTYLSDLKIPSPNWIYGGDYVGTEPERFFAILRSLELKYEDFVFVDFGSGKGRVLLMASEFPFKRILGVEFSPDLHAIAQANIQKYPSLTQKCRLLESVCMDFTSFPLPPEPSVLYFFDPCEEKLLAQTLANLRQSVLEHPRQVYIVYVAPRHERLLHTADFLHPRVRNEPYNYCVYQTTPGAAGPGVPGSPPTNPNS